jgi:hydroxymethylpyrimidine/phosphomethylpyrimidine kinase
MPIPVALTIAGSDPSGGAGIQADLKTFHQFGVYGTSALTLLTVQNTLRVDRMECLDPDLVRAQIRAVVEDLRPAAAKTGALGTASIVEAVGEEAAAFDFPLVVDPVMVSKHGLPLMAREARQALIDYLIPRAFLVTPNVVEAANLAGFIIAGVHDMRRAARELAAMGARNVLIKGGHLPGDPTDLLWTPRGSRELRATRIDTKNTHGTGCTYSAAITAELAQGSPLETAVERAKQFIDEAIRTNPQLGGGCGPVNHHARRLM